MFYNKIDDNNVNNNNIGAYKLENGVGNNNFGAYNPKQPLTEDNGNSVATEMMEFAKEQTEKLLAEFRGAAPGEYNERIVEGTFDVIGKLLNTAVKIEALNTLPRLGIDNDDVIKEIFRLGIFKD